MTRVRLKLVLASAVLLGACNEQCSCGNELGPQLGDPGQVDGLLVGDTTSQSAMIWVRVRREGPLVVRYGTRADESDARVTEQVEPDPSRDYTARLRLEDLQPATRYYYRVEAPDRPGSVLAGVGQSSFVTAPAGPAAFSVGFGSCMCPGTAQPIWRAVQNASPSVFLMIGDHHYGDTTDLAGLRKAYRTSRAIDGFARLARSVPVYGMWDDHDFTGNNRDGLAPGKEQALRAFEEYWANPARPTVTPGAWYGFAWGGVDFFVLDLRYWRNVEGTMLGEEQHAWLLAGLQASRAPFKVIVSSSAMNDGGLSDSWMGGHVHERDRLLDTIMEQRIGGVMVLSGDRHRAEVWTLREASERSYPVYEFVSSPLANATDPCPPERPGRVLCNTDDYNFGLLRFDLESATARMTYELRNTTGRVVFSLQAGADELQVPGGITTGR